MIIDSFARTSATRAERKTPGVEQSTPTEKTGPSTPTERATNPKDTIDVSDEARESDGPRRTRARKKTPFADNTRKKPTGPLRPRQAA